MFQCRLFSILAVLTLVGCASNPPVQPAASSNSQFADAVYGGETVELDKPTPGAEVYRAYHQGATGFVSLSSVRNVVETMASKHCARQGLRARPLQETASKPPHILGNSPRVEWLFECVSLASNARTAAPADKISQIERLKKLLDSGALTLQEYEAEKSKVVGGQ